MPNIAQKVGSAVNAASESIAKLNPDFRRRLLAMVAASGGRITINSGYRSAERQTQLWNAAVKKYGSEKAARKWVAPPGKSNHNHGLATDLGGDLELAHRLAPQYGLHFPMAWEKWHVEPLEHSADDDAYTTPPDDHVAVDPVMSKINALAAMVGAPMLENPMQQLAGVAGQGAGAQAPAGGGGDDFEKFFQKLTGVEGGRMVANKRTGAFGPTQIMPANWGPWAAEAGLGANAPKTQENLIAVSRFKLQQYAKQFGSLEAAAVAWYAGPDDAAIWVKNPNDPRFDKRPRPNEPSIREYLQRIG